MTKISNIGINFKSSDYDQVNHNCSTCSDTGFVPIENGIYRSAKRCECFKQKVISGIDKKIDKHRIDSYNEFQSKFVSNMKKSGKSSCWIYSPPDKSGVGKSAMLSHWLQKSKEDFNLIVGRKLPDQFLIQDEGKWIKIYHDFNKYKIIAIDDIDKRWPFSASVSDSIYQFLDDATINEGQKLIITSNLTIEQFCSDFSENKRTPLARRLRKKCFTFEE